MFRAFRWIRVWVASTCSTSEVPIPCASAPNAPWVAVWLSPQTMVMPGWVQPLLRADDVHDALADVVDAVVLDPEVGGVLLQRVDLDPALRVVDAAGAADVGRHVVVGNGDGLLGRADARGRPGAGPRRPGGW